MEVLVAVQPPAPELKFFGQQCGGASAGRAQVHSAPAQTVVALLFAATLAGAVFTVITTSFVDAVQGLLLMVQRSVYTPSVDGVNKASFALVLLNWPVDVDGLPQKSCRFTNPTPARSLQALRLRCCKWFGTDRVRHSRGGPRQNVHFIESRGQVPLLTVHRKV